MAGGWESRRGGIGTISILVNKADDREEEDYYYYCALLTAEKVNKATGGNIFALHLVHLIGIGSMIALGAPIRVELFKLNL